MRRGGSYEPWFPPFERFCKFLASVLSVVWFPEMPRLRLGVLLVLAALLVVPLLYHQPCMVSRFNYLRATCILAAGWSALVSASFPCLAVCFAAFAHDRNIRRRLWRFCGPRRTTLLRASC